METPPPVGNAATLLERGNDSLTINTVLSEKVTNLVQVLGNSEHIKTNFDIGVSQCVYIACKRLDDTSQQLETGIAGKKFYVDRS